MAAVLSFAAMGTTVLGGGIPDMARGPGSVPGGSPQRAGQAGQPFHTATVYSVGQRRIIDEIDGNTGGLPPEQQNAYKMLQALLQEHAALTAEIQSEGSEARAPQLAQVVSQIDRLLELAFAPERMPSREKLQAMGEPTDPPFVFRLTPHQARILADEADERGLPLAGLDKVFADGQVTPWPKTDLDRARTFVGELRGGQYTEAIPRDALGAPQLPVGQRGVLEVLRSLEGPARAALMDRAGYTQAQEGTDAREQEVRLGNQVTTPEALAAVEQLMRKYGLNPEEHARGVSGDQARTVVGALEHAIAEEQRRIEEERRRIEEEQRRLEEQRRAAEEAERIRNERTPASPVDTGAPRITSPYGMRRHPILKIDRMHNGADITAAMGVGLNTIYGGRVTKAGVNGGFGNHVRVDHGQVWYQGRTVHMETTYSHLSQIRVAVGQPVVKGQDLGASGSTGLSTKPHLHFEVWVNGERVNPATVFG